MPEHTLFICTTCATTWENGKRVRCGGEKLLEQLQLLHQNWKFKDKVSLQPVRCMSACNRACVFSLAASGKHTYLFGDIKTESETVLETSKAVLECAGQYYTNSEGLLPWGQRPPRLRKSVVAHIPPVSMPSESIVNGRSLAVQNS